MNNTVVLRLIRFGMRQILVILLVIIAGTSIAENNKTAAVIPVNETVLDASESGHIIAEVLERDEFNNAETIKIWRPKEKDDENKTDTDSNFLKIVREFAEFIAVIFKALAWVFALLGIFFIILYREKWLWLFKVKKKLIDEYEPPEQLFGMEITAESLPDDIPGAARKECAEGKYRSALSLLYRGALMELVQRHRIKLNSSLTESEVVLASTEKLADKQFNYLNQLTDEWIQTAYANRMTTKTSLLSLCDEWPLLRGAK